MLAAAVLVAVRNQAQIAAFRQSQVGRHKTDRADAALIARLVGVHQDEVRRATPDEPEVGRLRALVGDRDDLVARRRWLRCQQHHAGWAGETLVVAWLEADLAELARRLREVEAAIAFLPAGVLTDPRAAAVNAGVHPRQEQSGQRRASRLSKQGCPALRRYLYLAAMAAIRFDRELKTRYERLCARGKAAACALCAVAHQLLRWLTARIRDQRAAKPPALPLAA